MKLKFIVLFTSLFAFFSQGFSQDTIRGRVSLRGGYVISQDTPEFERFEGMRDCCNGYDATEGDGLLLNIEAGLRLWLLDVNFGIGYGNISNSFYGEDTQPVLNAERQEVSGVFSHNLDTERTFLLPNASIGLSPIWGLRVYGGAGMVLHQSQDYDYIEKIESPNQGVFTETNSRSRNPQTGEIINIDNPLYIFGGFSYELPMSRDLNLYLVPFVEFSHYQSSLLTTNTWEHFNYSGGIGITYHLNYGYGFDTYTPILREETNIDTVIVSGIEISPDLSGTIRLGESFTQTKIDTIQKDTREFEVITQKTTTRTDTLFKNIVVSLDLSLSPDFFSIPIEFYTESIPILPYFFFEKNSTLLSTKQLNNSDWEKDINTQKSRYSYVYENTLSLIANRLIKSGSSITITGYIDPTSENNCDLSRNRAEVIKGLLMERGVNEKQIKVEKAATLNCAPVEYTKTQSEPAYQENRRVEITSDDNSIFSSFLLQSAPRVMAVSKDKFVATYKFSSANTEVITPEAINKIFDNIKIMGTTQSNSFEFTIDTLSPMFSVPFYPNLTEENKVTVAYLDNTLPIQNGDTSISFTALTTDASGNTLSDTESLWIRYDTSAVSKSRVSIVLFPVGKSELTELAKTELMSYTDRLRKGEDLTVIGYADDIGNPEDNKRLADERANAVISYLKRIRPDLNPYFTETSGFPIGVSSFSTPQERLLSRTVQIEADIKLKK